MTALRLDGISKNFGVIRALGDAPLKLEPARMLGLIGDSGAGNFPPTRGTIGDGFAPLIDARRHGIEA